MKFPDTSYDPDTLALLTRAFEEDVQFGAWRLSSSRLPPTSCAGTIALIGNLQAK